MMKIFKSASCRFLCLAVVLWCSTMSAHAVVGEVKAAIDTPLVLVGMPRVLHLEVTVPKDAHLAWPILQKMGGVAAVDMEDMQKSYLLEFGPDTRFDIDTLSVTDTQVTLSQDLQVFAFDSAAMVIKPIAFVVNETDTLFSPVVALNCDQPFEEVPADVQAMQGIKDIKDPPFVLWDYLRWVVFVLAILLIIAAVVSLVLYLLKRGYKKTAAVEAPVERRPAHVIAMDALLDLEQKHLWEKGCFKEFHTELTDILRRYLERRYQVQALESTSDEIMSELVELQIHQKSSYNNLRDILVMADLAKFAKYEPSADENRMSYCNARLFVEQTKEVIVEKQPGEAPKAADNDNINNN